jgi:ribose transport system ATP-binding protein
VSARLVMRGVRKRFGATQALGGVDLVVGQGEVHALLGQNGAGKSTLMKVLSGAIAPDEGEMELDGRPYRPTDPLAARRAGVAMIYQELALAPHLTVAENILLGVEPRRRGLLDAAGMRERAGAALAELRHPELPLDAPVGSLPIAKQQIVEIARSLAVGCQLLVLDEPTSSLTQADAESLFALVERLRAQGKSIVYITHFLEEAKRIASRYTVLRDGRTVGAGDIAQVEIGALVDLMVGQRLEELFPRSARRRGEPVLELADVAGAGKPAAASLTLHRGEVVGIAGLVGAGRTELLRLLAGLEPVRAGRIRLGSYEGPASTRQRWGQGLALVSENRKEEGLATGLGVADNLTLSKMPRFLRPARRRAEVEAWIARMHIRCSGADQPVAQLSGGNQQKIAIARLLHHDVDVLLLDEPTRGIDVGSKAQIYDLVDALVTKMSPPKAVLVVSSYLPELLGICDRIAVMCRGRLGPARPVAGLTEQDLVREASTGEASAS